MTDRPILFSAPMVRALLDGRKSMTRRVLKPQPHHAAHVFQDGGYWYAEAKLGPGSDCIEVNAVEPGYAPGDRLWVRETWRRDDYDEQQAIYRADFPHLMEDDLRCVRWRPSIHMPRWASRLTLTVTDVRVQRVQEISAFDGIAEGWPGAKEANSKGGYRWFAELWDSLNAPRGFGWDANPWVVALTFTVERRNIDQIEAAA